MSCNRTSTRKLGRKKYSLIPNLPQNKNVYVSKTNIEVENLIVEVTDTASKTVLFNTPFSGIPSVVANFVSLSGNVNVSVYVSSITSAQAIIQMSAPVTGQIHIHAMYIEG